jgi:ankyrin repeat protein
LLHYAIAANNTKVVSFLLEKDYFRADLEKRVITKPLFWAVSNQGCDPNMIRVLYNNGVELGSKTLFDDSNVLLEAVELGQTSCARYIFKLSCSNNLQLETHIDRLGNGMLARAKSSESNETYKFAQEVLESGCK